MSSSIMDLSGFSMIKTSKNHCSIQGGAKVSFPKTTVLGRYIASELVVSYFDLMGERLETEAW